MLKYGNEVIIRDDPFYEGVQGVVSAYKISKRIDSYENFEEREYLVLLTTQDLKQQVWFPEYALALADFEKTA